MKKKDYMEMEKEYKKGTKLLITIFVIIVLTAITLNYYYGT